jgi:4-hydroxyphenylpyruvate dioxygenase-like putative hemolysin
MSTQNIRRVDHVMYIAWPENQAAYVEQLSKLCGVKFYGPVEKPEFGVRLYISWAAGLEVVSPVSDTAPWSLHMRAHLEKRGEGVMNIIFGVKDINEARARAEALGYKTSDIIENTGDEPYAAETEIMKETVVGEIMNTMFTFGEIKLGPNPLI